MQRPETVHQHDDAAAGPRPAGVEIIARGWTWQHADRCVPALDGLNLHIAAGERVLLAGPSGAGKSTLLHGLAGVLPATDQETTGGMSGSVGPQDEEARSSGELLLDGRSPDAARGRAGLVQQDPESQVVLSRIGDDIAFAAENLAVPRAEIGERVAEALAAVGLADFDLDHPTERLSGGQKQRLALAGVLAMRPGLLLLDEPTAQLDPEGVTQVRDAVVAVAAGTGATVVVVEHRAEVWADHMDTLVILEPGGGVRGRAPATQIRHDAGLREDLAKMGLWVPGCGRPRELLEHGRAVSGSSSLSDVVEDASAPAHAAETLLTADGLSISRASPRKSWRRTPPAMPTLSGVDLTLNSGSALGITGPNGAGKSTLLLTLAGLIPAHAGRLIASDRLKVGALLGRGEVPGETRFRKPQAYGTGTTGLPDSPYRWRSVELVARIGMVFQEPEHQFVRPTVREELALGAAEARLPGSSEPLYRKEEITARVDRLLIRLRLDHLAEVNPFTLSGGEKRRLSVGTGLAAGPEALMLDEPTFGQDAATFAEMVALLREHLDEGGTVVAVTHDEMFLQSLQAEQYDVGSCARSPEPEISGLLTDRRQRDLRGVKSPTKDGGQLPMLSGVRSGSWLGRRNALAKLIGVLLVTLALVMTIDPVSSAVVILMSFALLPLAGIRISAFLTRIWPFAVGAVVAVWGTAVAAEESGRVLLDLGFTTVSQGSVALGVALGLRAFAIVLPSVIVFSTTDPTDLADSLAQQMRLPVRFVLGALASMRLLGLLAEHWMTLGQARRARGIGAHGRAVKKLRSASSQAFGLLVQAIRAATRLGVTMEARGFGATERTWARVARFRAADIPVVVGALVIAIVATGAAIVTGSWNFVWT